MESSNNQRPAQELNSDQLEKVETLKMITNLEDHSKAVQYLEMCNWNQENAVNIVLETGGAMPPTNPQNDNSPPYIPPEDPYIPPDSQPQMQGYMDMDPYDDPYGGGYMENYGQSARVPEFTEEETQYYNINMKKNDPGLLKNLNKGINYLKNSFFFKGTTGKQFLEEINRQKKTEKKIFLDFKNTNLEDVLENLENKSDQPALIYIHRNDSSYNKKIIENLLVNENLGQFQNQKFKIFGMQSSNPEIKLLEMVSNDQIPCFMVLRRDKFDKLDPISVLVFNNEADLNTDSVKLLLDESLGQFRTKLDQDKNFIRVYERKREERRVAIQRNMAFGQQANFGFGFEQGFTNQNYENDSENYYRQQQRAQLGNNTFSQNVPFNQQIPPQQVNPVNPTINLPPNPQGTSNQNIPTSNQNISTSNQNISTGDQNIDTNTGVRSNRQVQIEEERRLKEEQDRQYQEMLNQSRKDYEEKMKRQEEEENKRILESIKKNEDKERKNNIINNMPQEPEKGENVVNIVYRLPSGGRQNRRFLKSEKLQLIHDYVMIMENVGFESKNDAEYDIQSGYPPSIIENLDQTLEEKFKNSKQELILVKEKEM